MFIKTSVRKKEGKEFKTHYLTEGYRDKDGKVKHKYLSNISDLPDDIILFLKAKLKDSGKREIEKVDLNSMKLLSSLEFGNIAIFTKLYDQYFGKYFTDTRYNEALKMITINKIFDPKSKNGLKNWMKEVDLDFKITNKNDLYDCLDYLELEQPKIEKRLSKKNQDKNCKSSSNNNILLVTVQ